jgi:membrane protein implicated in regulation of membrane protease activity
MVAGIWEFIAGDDWLTAVGVAIALALTGLVSDDSAAWVVMPIAVAALLALSIRREARKRDSTPNRFL